MSSITLDDGLIRVSGALTVGTVSEVLEASKPLFSAQLKGFDLGGVSDVDSTALALVVEWLRIAQAMDIQVEFEQIPSVLLDLAQSLYFEEIVPAFHV